MPALRERMEDLPILVQEILRPLAKEMGRPIPKVSPRALKKLETYPWPGNIRELRNVLERALLTLRADEIRSEDLQIDRDGGPAVAPRSGSLPVEEWDIQPLDQVVGCTSRPRSRPRAATSERRRGSSRSVHPLSMRV